MKIFISHSSSDYDFVKELTSFLEESGHKTSNEKIFKPNASPRSIISLIDQSMKGADFLIVIWSKRSAISLGIQQELVAMKMLADTDNSKKMLVINLDGAEIPIEIRSNLVLRMKSSNPNFHKLLDVLESRAVSTELSYKVESNASRDRGLEQLKSSHEEGKLTLVCGAGVSIGANIPTWNTLLDRLLFAMAKRLATDVNEAEFAKSDLRDVRDASSLIAGRYLKNVLQDDFEQEVRDALYRDNHQTCEIIDAIVELARPKRGKAHLDSIITFNFDDLLELNLKAASIEHKAISTEGARSSAAELPIFHVHGYLPSKGKLPKGTKIVFSEDAYHDQFVDPFSWSNLTQLSKFTQNTCLFVGLSMTDPNLRRLLDVAKRRDEKSDSRHYVILKRDLNSSRSRMMESLREQDAASLGILILWVDEFEEIPKLIRDIA